MAQVLVLDDESSIGRLIDAILSGAGYEVQCFTRAKDALEALENFEPDAIISDINMPGMDGLEFCRIVREKDRFHFTPFIFLSALSERRDMREGMNQGADDYLTKPFTSQELLESLEVRIRRSEELKPVKSESIEARALGEASLTWKGQEVVWGSKKAAEFFFLLLEHPNGVTTWEAAEALWPDKDESKAASVFHTTLHRLRKTLEMDIVQSTNRRYYIAPDLDIVYDVREYLATAKGAQVTKDQALFDKAAQLYRGSYLSGFESAWCEDQRDTLHATHLSLLTDASKVFESQNNIQQAAWYAHLAAQHEPYSDTVWTELARLFDVMGDTRRAERARERSSNWDY